MYKIESTIDGEMALTIAIRTIVDATGLGDRTYAINDAEDLVVVTEGQEPEVIRKATDLDKAVFILGRHLHTTLKEVVEARHAAKAAEEAAKEAAAVEEVSETDR